MGKVIFSFCSHLPGGGTPSRSWWGGTPGLGELPHPRSGLWRGIHPRSGWWGVPHPSSGVGGTLVRSGWWRVPHSWGGGTPARSGWWGVPHPWGGGTPGQVWMVGEGYLIREGVPWPGLDGRGYPIHGVGGTSARSGWWGVPHPWGYPDQVRMVEGYPSQVWMVGGVPIRQSSIASPFYAAGGMPLAITQEDFLVPTLITNYFIICFIMSSC